VVTLAAPAQPPLVPAVPDDHYYRRLLSVYAQQGEDSLLTLTPRQGRGDGVGTVLTPPPTLPQGRVSKEPPLPTACCEHRDRVDELERENRLLKGRIQILEGKLKQSRGDIKALQDKYALAKYRAEDNRHTLHRPLGGNGQGSISTLRDRDSVGGSVDSLKQSLILGNMEDKDENSDRVLSIDALPLGRQRMGNIYNH